MTEFTVLVMSLLIVCLPAVNGQVKIGGKDGVEKLTFKTPDLTDEESFSHFLPESMKCDACRAIAYQVSLSI